MRDDRTPILVGVSQLVQRDADPREAPDPVSMVETVARQAAEDAGAGERVLRDLDTIALVNLGMRSNGNPPRLVGERLGARARQEYVSEMGGQIGVTLANLVGEQITRGEASLALVAGSNNLRTLTQARKQGVELNWPKGGEGAPEMIGKLERGGSEREGDYGLRMPPDVYPIFENALRAARGLDLETHRERLGALFSRFTEVAAANPHAWFPKFRSPEEIITVTPENRMIAYPYTKYLNAVLFTDQAAALLITSVAEARSRGIPEDRWVYWWGGTHTQEEAWLASERPSFAECPSMLDASQGALENAGVTIDDIDLIDFYSCFPVAVELAAAQLGLAEDDPRGFTVTGGLPYAGGPASAYCLHSIAAMAERLREQPGTKGLATGNGWYLTKHAASVWSTEPKPGDPPSAELATAPPVGSAERAPVPVDPDARGTGTVETYTVLYDRDGAPARGIVLGRDEDGKRFLANTPTDRELLESFVAVEQVGRRGALGERDGRVCFEPS